MCSCLSKEEDKYSQVMKQAEFILHKTVYYIMPEPWPRRIFSRVVNANSNILEKRVRTMLSNKELLRVTCRQYRYL